MRRSGRRKKPNSEVKTRLQRKNGDGTTCKEFPSLLKQLFSTPVNTLFPVKSTKTQWTLLPDRGCRAWTNPAYTEMGNSWANEKTLSSPANWTPANSRMCLQALDHHQSDTGTLNACIPRHDPQEQDSDRRR